MTLEPLSEAIFAAFLSNVGATDVGDLPPCDTRGGARFVTPQTADQRQPIVRDAVTIANLSTMIGEFDAWIDQSGIQLESNVRIDLLAAFLSSQFLLFAGPSGTGKSTVARELQGFFCPADSRSIIDSRRQLIGPEDIAGFRSPFVNEFFEGLNLRELEWIARPPPTAASPSLLVEEINLSPAEGYLSPLVHGFSGLSSDQVTWRLFAQEGEVVLNRGSALRIEPWLRLLGTINVDATADAPAPKVAARACVILLEPATTDDLTAAWTTMTTVQAGAVPPDGPGASLVGDPLQGLRSVDARRDLVTSACLKAVRLAESGKNAGNQPISLASRRQLGQMLLFCTWYDLLARAYAAKGGLLPDPDEAPRIGAENALLHHLLPSLSAEAFSSAMRNLGEAADRLSHSPAPGTSLPGTGDLGGLLEARLTRFRVTTPNSLLGRSLDFWDYLS